VFNNAARLLGCAWEEAGHISESDDWDLEGVAEADEASGLNGGINVQATSQDLGLICDDTNRFTFNFDETSKHILSVRRHDLVEFVSISHRLNHNVHIVGLVRVIRNNVVQDFSARLVSRVGGSPGLLIALLPRVLREEAHQFPGACNGLNIVLENTM